MYKLLVVDDEEIAVRGIVEGIDWEDIDVNEVFSAYNAGKALSVLEKENIDVIICDIEMPGLDGIELLKKINKKWKKVSTIFLTGHAKFDYAQEAVKLGCFDYLLKPIDHQKLKGTVSKALQVVKEKASRAKFIKTYKKYYNLWQEYQPILIERFWQDVFSKRFLNTEWIKKSLDLYEMSLTPANEVLPVLLSIEEWKVSLNGKDEEIMKYAIRNTAAEMLEENFEGIVIQNYDGNNLVIVYDDPAREIDDIREYCHKLKNYCNEKLHAVISCYLGKYTAIQESCQLYNKLLEMEKNNIRRVNSVVLLSETEHDFKKSLQNPPFQKWKTMYESGKGKKLVIEIKKYFSSSERINSEILQNFYFGLFHMIYEVMHEKGLAIKDVYNVQQFNELMSSKSIKSMHEKLKNIILTGAEHINKADDTEPEIIGEIKSFIKENYKKDIKRKDIAGYVCYNPAYLSRLFKKETKQTLSEYITEIRLNEARRLLKDTDNTITSIAEEIGYSNYSYFSKIFKEKYGVTPNDYRK